MYCKIFSDKLSHSSLFFLIVSQKALTRFQKLFTFVFGRYFYLSYKVNSVQEACAKCFTVHLYQNLKSCKPHEKVKQKKHQNAKSIGEKLKNKGLMCFDFL